MKPVNISKPCGLQSLCSEVQSVCEKAYAYRRSGIKPRHLIVPLDSGSGRTTFLTYVTDMFKAHEVLDFSSGLDDFIEVQFDGSPRQLEEAFSEIDCAAIYDNYFTGVIGMDIANLATHLGEIQFTEFLKQTKEISKHAYLVFFIPSSPTKNQERLIVKLSSTVDRIKRIEVEPYTTRDLVDLAVQKLKDQGLRVKNVGVVKDHLAKYFTDKKVRTVKDTLLVVENLLFGLDYSKDIPILNKQIIEEFVSLKKDKERTNE